MDQSETVMKPIKATRSASGGQQQQSSSSADSGGGGGGGGGNGGLKFGPAWLRQLSCGETSNKTGLPPSPGLAFQLAKNRYAREEMIAIYEVIEKQLKSAPAPARLLKDFGELCKRELQRPVCLSQPSPEEQKLLSTCVNSQIALNAYNKSQGISGDRSGGDRSQAANESSSSYHRSSNGAREIANGKGGRGGGGSNRGNARGGGGYNSDRSSNGPSLSSSVTSANQSGRERVDRADRNDRSGRGEWRSQMSSNQSERSSTTSSTSYQRRRSSNDIDYRHESSIEYESGSTISGGKYDNRYNGESSSNKYNESKYQTVTTTSESYPEWMDEKATGAAADDDESEPESNPEWFENGEPIVDDKEHEMTFDEEGKYVLAKEVVAVDDNKSKSVANKGEKSSGSFQTGVSSTPSISSSSNASSSSTSPSDPNNAASKTSTAASYLKTSASNNESISKSSSFSAFPPYHQHHNYDLLDQNKSELMSNLMSNQLNDLQQENTRRGASNERKQQQHNEASELSNARFGSVAIDHPDADKWFYLDPQNNVQGPFNSEQMAAWCAAGYFSLNLQMKRGSDEKFVPFGILASLGRTPFAPNLHPPPPLINPQQQQQLIKQLNTVQQSQMNSNMATSTTNKPIGPNRPQIPNPMQQNQQPESQSLQQQLQLLQQLSQQLNNSAQPRNNNLNNDLVKNMSQQGNVANILGLLQQFEQLQVQQQKPAQSSSQNQMNEQQALLALMAAAAAQQQSNQSQSASFNPHQIPHQNQMNTASASAKISSLSDSSFCDPAILDAAIVSATLPHSNQTTHLPQTHHHQQQQPHPMNNRNFFPHTKAPQHHQLDGQASSNMPPFWQQHQHQQQQQIHNQNISQLYYQKLSQHQQQQQQQQQLLSKQRQQLQQQQQLNMNVNVNKTTNSLFPEGAQALSSRQLEQLKSTSQFQAMLSSDESVKEKFDQLYEQTRREEEKRRKIIEEELILKRQEEKRRLEEIRLKQQQQQQQQQQQHQQHQQQHEEMRRQEEEKVRERMQQQAIEKALLNFLCQNLNKK